MRQGRRAWAVRSQPPQPWVTFSLLVAIILLSSPSPRQGSVALYLIVLGVLLGLSLRWRVGLLALGALLVAGIDLRVQYFGTGFSDVLVVTRAAIEHVLAGGNPYGVGYEASVPPGAPFPYGPLALLWYLPAEEPRILEMAASFLILGLLALRGRPLGLAIYATAPILLGLAGDGSNDTSAGLLLLGALALLPLRPAAGAFLLGLAIAFKPHALAWLPPLVAWLGLPALVPVLLGAGLFWLPALLAWGLGAVLESIRAADRVHLSPYYSLGQALQHLGLRPSPELLNLLRLVVGAATSLVVMLHVRSAQGVIVGGLLIFLATLYSGFWATFAYLAAIAPVVCWYLDEWLGMADRRVIVPGDPLGRLAAAVDRRWPARAPAGEGSPA